MFLLQTLLSEYHSFAAKIDELNEVGSVYDASLKGIEISTTPVTRSKFHIYLKCLDLFILRFRESCHRFVSLVFVL